MSIHVSVRFVVEGALLGKIVCLCICFLVEKPEPMRLPFEAHDSSSPPAPEAEPSAPMSALQRLGISQPEAGNPDLKQRVRGQKPGHMFAQLRGFRGFPVCWLIGKKVWKSG